VEVMIAGDVWVDEDVCIEVCLWVKLIFECSQCRKNSWLLELGVKGGPRETRREFGEQGCGRGYRVVS
jgi:hypothetical protein